MSIKTCIGQHGPHAVASAANVTGYAVRRWAQGTTQPTRATAATLADVFGGYWPDYTESASTLAITIADAIRYLQELATDMEFISEHEARIMRAKAGALAVELRRLAQ